MLKITSARLSCYRLRDLHYILTPQIPQVRCRLPLTRVAHERCFGILPISHWSWEKGRPIRETILSEFDGRKVVSETKVIGLSCSARKNGNTSSAIGVALDYLSKMDVETELIHLTDYDIKACRNCEMECYYEKQCPTPDDSKKLAGLLDKCDGLIVGSPLYNGTIPALLAAFLERQPFPYEDFLNEKVTSAIIIGSLGETFAALILTSWLAPGKHFVGWIELDPRGTAARNPGFRDSWLKGNMMEEEQNQKSVIELASKVYTRIKASEIRS